MELIVPCRDESSGSGEGKESHTNPYSTGPRFNLNDFPRLGKMSSALALVRTTLSIHLLHWPNLVGCPHFPQLHQLLISTYELDSKNTGLVHLRSEAEEYT